MPTKCSRPAQCVGWTTLRRTHSTSILRNSERSTDTAASQLRNVGGCPIATAATESSAHKPTVRGVGGVMVSSHSSSSGSSTKAAT